MCAEWCSDLVAGNITAIKHNALSAIAVLIGCTLTACDNLIAARHGFRGRIRRRSKARNAFGAGRSVVVARNFDAVVEWHAGDGAIAVCVACAFGAHTTSNTIAFIALDACWLSLARNAKQTMWIFGTLAIFAILCSKALFADTVLIKRVAINTLGAHAIHSSCTGHNHSTGCEAIAACVACAFIAFTCGSVKAMVSLALEADGA